jgi:hypothetical protein
MTLCDESKKSSFFPDAFNWWEMPQSCGRCRLPLHMASGQDVAFCPNCAIDAKNAYNGRAMLALAKAKDLQSRIANVNYPGGAFFSGMPL